LTPWSQACVKLTPELSQVTGTADHAVANTMCAGDNTRLAVAETTDEKAGLVAWINKFYSSLVSVTFLLLSVTSSLFSVTFTLL
jgi:hypothetical protein